MEVSPATLTELSGGLRFICSPSNVGIAEDIPTQRTTDFGRVLS